MVRYDLHEIDRAIKAHNGTSQFGGESDQVSRPGKRRWDYVIRAVCSGCGRTLRQYEVRNRLAYCFSCRRILFPEPMPAYESSGRRRYYPSRSRGQSW